MKRFYFLMLAVLVTITTGCGGGKEVKQDTTDPNVALISTQNGQLANHPIDGFGYKSSKLDTTKWDNWAASAAPVVKEILNKLPEGYVLQVTGHSDASGPEEPVGNKPGNLKISKDRAKTVYDALKRADIKSPNLTYKGIGSDELVEGADPRAAEQRRVTFKVLPKE